MPSTQSPSKPRRQKLLTDTAIRTAKPQDKPYKLPDAGGLYLLVQTSGARLWRYRFWLHDKEGLLALGKYPDVPLLEARKRHAEARQLVARGVNPVHEGQRAKQEAAQEQQRAALGTFGAVCLAWQEITSPKLRPASIRQRNREVNNDLLPKFKDRAVDSITRLELAAHIRLVEKRAPETARNLRTHLFAIFEHAIDTGLLQSNPTPPARLLQPRRPKNHTAMPEGRIGDFLRALDGSTADPETRIAFLLTILSACRKDEAIGARWDEFDLDAALWTIPAERMKAKREHLVPLPHQAVTLVRELREIATGLVREHLFPNRRDPKRPMANRSLNAVLDRLGFGGEATVHGWRAVFSTRYNAQGANPDVVEACLAHVHDNAVRRAYNRANYLEQRRELLQDWADWLESRRASTTNG
jgi:integrase